MSAAGDSGVVRVRPVTREDLPRLWDLVQGLATYERMSDVLTGSAAGMEQALFDGAPRIEGLVAEHRGRLVGYALFFPVFSSFRTAWRLWLEDLFVEPDARGTGAGRALMAELARIALTRGWIAMDWEVLDWNALALGFYDGLGAGRVGTDWYRYRLSGDALRALAGDPGSVPAAGEP